MHELTKALGSGDAATLAGTAAELRTALVAAVEPQLPPSPEVTMRAVAEAESAAGGSGGEAGGG